MILSFDLEHRRIFELALACLAAAGLLIVLSGCVSVPAKQPEETFTSIAFSPDQALLAYANAHEIRLIDTGSWRHVRTLRAVPADSEGAPPQFFRHGVGDNMVFLDNARIASTGMGGLVTIWDARGGQQLAKIEPLPGDEYASTIDYSGVNGRLAIGTSGGQILLTTLKDRQLDAVAPLANTPGLVWDLQFSRDGKYLASASLMPASSTFEYATAGASEEAADAWASSHNREEPVSPTNVESSGEAADAWASSHNTEGPAPPNVLIWDLEGQEKVGELEGAAHVLRMALVPGQQALLTVGSDVEVWTFLGQEQLEEVSDPSMAAQGIAIGTLTVISVAGMTMGGLPNVPVGQTLLNMAQLPIPTAASMRHACARAAAISPDGQTIVSTKRGPSHNVMAVIDRAKNKVIEKWMAESSICDMQFSQDGKYLVAATSRGVFLFDTTNWKKTDLKNLVLKNSSG